MKKMKKAIVMLLCLVLAAASAGCGGDDPAGKAGNQPTGVKDVLEAGMSEADSKNAGTAPSSEENPADTAMSSEIAATEDTETAAETSSEAAPAAAGGYADIDVDLTVLSSTMVYSEVYNMLYEPQKYIGKVVKMKGPFAFFRDEATGVYYFACIIKDATACCAQGIEFVLAGEHRYPDDYPKAGEEICVVGVFDTYVEGEYTYCTLRNAELL